MTDNITVTPGAGATIAADDIGTGVLAQRVKPVWGPDGTGNDVDIASGKPLPVQLRSPTGTDLTGSAGTASAAVLTVQGIASATALPVNHGKTIKSVSGSITATTDVVAAVTSKRIKVIAYSVITLGVTAADYIFKSNNSTEVWRIAAQAPAASSMFGANLSMPAPSFLFATVAGEKLTLAFSTGSDTIKYAISYFDDDAT